MTTILNLLPNLDPISLLMTTNMINFPLQNERTKPIAILFSLYMIGKKMDVFIWLNDCHLVLLTLTFIYSFIFILTNIMTH